MAYDKIVDSIYLDNGLTEIAAAIREKTATTELLSFPTGMAAAIGAIKAGGGAVSKGAIYVSYPVGSTCTLTNGSEIFAAPDTSGSTMFIVDPGTWTASISNGSENASKSVTVAMFEYQQLTIFYGLVLVPNLDITWTPAKNNTSSSTMEILADGRLKFVVKKGSNGTTAVNAHFCSSAVDVTEFTRMEMYYSVQSTGSGTLPLLRSGISASNKDNLSMSSVFRSGSYMIKQGGMQWFDLSDCTGLMYLYTGWLKDTADATYCVDSFVLK